MILPERTVDAWTAAYITGRSWHARLWAPTEQRIDEAYDLAVGLNQVLRHARPQRKPWVSKLFVFEHKGVYLNRRKAYVRIPFRQHVAHVAADRLRGPRLVFYLLPSPDWHHHAHGSIGTLPNASLQRTPGGGGKGFQSWTWVISVIAMDSWLKHHGPVPRGQQDPIWHIDTALLGRIPGANSLRAFISDVRDCKRGISAAQSHLVQRFELPKLPDGVDDWRASDADQQEPEFDGDTAGDVDEPGHTGDERGEPPGEGFHPADDNDDAGRLSWLTYYGVGEHLDDQPTRGGSSALERVLSQ